MKKLIAILLSLCLLLPVFTAFADNSAMVITITGDQLGSQRITRNVSTPLGDEGWTILVYLCGTDLETRHGCATNDLTEMIEGAFGPQVRAVVQTGGTAEWQKYDIPSDQICRYLVEDHTLELVESLPSASMGNPETLASFIRWGVKNYGAAHTALVVWDHGGGTISGVCIDELYDRRGLSLRDLDTALMQVFPDMTDKFEFIGFDACLMSSLELANILSPYARYMFASQEVEPGTGWDYTALLGYLVDHPDADGAELGREQCQFYYESCIQGETEDKSTFAIIDLSKVDDLIAAFDTAARELCESGELISIARAGILTEDFGGNSRAGGYTNMIDLRGFLTDVSDIAPSAGAALAALDEAVISNHNGDHHKNAGGLSMYYPLSNVPGSNDLSTFRDVAVSTYYLELVTEIYSMINSGDYHEGDCPLVVTEVTTDQHGTYTVYLQDTELLAYGSCEVCRVVNTDGHTRYLYIGRDDNVNIDWEQGIVTDSFNGRWLFIGDEIAPIQLTDRHGRKSHYTVQILCNGELENLQLEYDWDAQEYTLLGIWGGVDENGMCDRVDDLKPGDEIQIVYELWTDIECVDIEYSDPFIYDGDLNIHYDDLPADEYEYCIFLYDVFGHSWNMANYTIFGIREDRSLYSSLS